MPDSDLPLTDDFNLAAAVLATAARHPDKSALEVVGGPQFSYGALEAAVRGCGSLLLSQGLQPLDRVLLRLGNSPAFPILFLGAIAAGLVPVPTSAALTMTEITPMARAVAPRLVVAEPGVALPGIEVPVLSSAAILAAANLPPCAWNGGSADRLAYVVFTSGTTGRPLPVAHAHRVVVARRIMQRHWEGLTAQDRLLHAGAMNWTYTLGTGLIDPWMTGATALIPAPGTAAAELPGLLARQKATIFAAAPGVYRQMLRAPFPALPRLRHGLSAGEALPETLAQAWVAATGTRVHQALGLSECSTFVSGAPDHPAPPGTIGPIQPGRRAAVLDRAFQPLPPGSAGMLAVHRDDPGLMLGYLGLPAETAAKFRGDWFLTGDHVASDESGAIRYLGRDDDMMNPGGYRVSPLEVEAALASLPGLSDCAVVEVEATPGNRIIACLFVAGPAITKTALADHAAGVLARYKQPRLLIRLDALPRNANNKLDRAALRALAAAHLTRKDES